MELLSAPLDYLLNDAWFGKKDQIYVMSLCFEGGGKKISLITARRRGKTIGCTLVTASASWLGISDSALVFRYFVGHKLSFCQSLTNKVSGHVVKK